ncbi:MAG: heparan-alpha-glucosaminide N-acetyltransferase domain-containing protein [Coriobacteriia bacterium]|nr:heparan-alpha-glucosaminide N-acetyltransferase domain-containing protein [Coriobacteriia bacterium]
MDHPMIRAALPDFLVHPDWHGFRLPDFVFPAFIYMAGVSMAYSVSRKAQMDFRAASIVFVRRIITLFGIGLALNFFKYSVRVVGGAVSLAPLRYLGVLQRIALSTLIAWPFTRKPMRWGITAATVLLVVHAGILLFVAPPGGIANDLDSKTENISAWIDRTVLGEQHAYLGRGYDPEGVLGTLSSGALALLGLMVGKWLVKWPEDTRKVHQLGWIGLGMIALALALAPILPINKQLWSPTFTLISAGVATVSFAAMYRIADLGGHARLFEWLVPLGRNALLIYICSNILVVVGRFTGAFPGVGLRTAQYMPDAAASLLWSGAEVVMWFFVAGALYRRKIFLKL